MPHCGCRNEDARLRAGERRGVQRADRSEFIEEEERDAGQANVAAIMRIRWMQAAALDLPQSQDFLAENHPHLVHFTIAKLPRQQSFVKGNTNRGRPGREKARASWC